MLCLVIGSYFLLIGVVLVVVFIMGRLGIEVNIFFFYFKKFVNNEYRFLYFYFELVKL